jgi:hypothetical protein
MIRRLGMIGREPERMVDLRERVEQQRKTVESLQREGHFCPDAERQLHYMTAKLQASDHA